MCLSIWRTSNIYTLTRMIERRKHLIFYSQLARHFASCTASAVGSPVDHCPCTDYVSRLKGNWRGHGSNQAELVAKDACLGAKKSMSENQIRLRRDASTFLAGPWISIFLSKIGTCWSRGSNHFFWAVPPFNVLQQRSAPKRPYSLLLPQHV